MREGKHYAGGGFEQASRYGHTFRQWAHDQGPDTQ